MATSLEVFSDLSERLAYNSPDFPLYAKKGFLNQFDEYKAACHWHYDLEFILNLEGSMDYYVNNRIVTIGEGEGIFVNSKRLHYGFSPMGRNCVFYVIAIHPSLFSRDIQSLSSLWENRFGPDREDFILLKPAVAWQRELLRLLETVFDEMHREERDLFLILSRAALVCSTLSSHIALSENSSDDNRSWQIVQSMTRFIHRNYAGKISLEDISRAGALCRSRCCRLFRDYLSQTPLSYLNQFRLRKSCTMLIETDRSISEIAAACGFGSASYFTSLFGKSMNITPREYRESNRRGEAPDGGTPPSYAGEEGDPHRDDG